MKVLSLFDGISCGRVALDCASFSVERYVAYEIEPWAVKVSQKNYPSIEHRGDVFKGDYTEYKGFDLLLGGSPCQSFSICKRDRETTPDGIGGKLFMEYVRALREASPRYFLYENNYSIHQNIKDFISEQLGVRPIIINSALVSAQSRKRCYWTNIPDISQPDDRGICVNDIVDKILEDYIDYTKTHEIHWSGKKVESYSPKIEQIGYINKGRQGERVYSPLGKSANLTANSGGLGAKTGLYYIDGHVRMLSPLEAERLQTLPDNFTSVEGITNTARYRCVGNGWTVEVIAHILRHIPKVVKNTSHLEGLFEVFQYG